MEGSETYNHSKDVRPRRDASKQCLNKMQDDRRAEVHGQQKPSNDPRNNQHNLGTPTTGHR